MRSLRVVLLILISMVTSGCIYPGINGKVLDNATGKPIEGAVVVAQWTKTHGFGLTYHDLHKITETLTDKEGKFSLSGTFALFIDPPEMIICKEGYIPWRNDSIFPSLNTVKNHEWNHNMTYRLDVFTDKYTAGQLANFVNSGMTLGMGLSESKKFSDLANKLSGKEYDEIRKQKSMDISP